MANVIGLTRKHNPHSRGNVRGIFRQSGSVPLPFDWDTPAELSRDVLEAASFICAHEVMQDLGLREDFEVSLAMIAGRFGVAGDCRGKMPTVLMSTRQDLFQHGAASDATLADYSSPGTLSPQGGTSPYYTGPVWALPSITNPPGETVSIESLESARATPMHAPLSCYTTASNSNNSPQFEWTVNTLRDAGWTVNGDTAGPWGGRKLPYEPQISGTTLEFGGYQVMDVSNTTWHAAWTAMARALIQSSYPVDGIFFTFPKSQLYSQATASPWTMSGLDTTFTQRGGGDFPLIYLWAATGTDNGVAPSCTGPPSNIQSGYVGGWDFSDNTPELVRNLSLGNQGVPYFDYPSIGDNQFARARWWAAHYELAKTACAMCQDIGAPFWLNYGGNNSNDGPPWSSAFRLVGQSSSEGYRGLYSLTQQQAYDRLIEEFIELCELARKTGGGVAIQDDDYTSTTYSNVSLRQYYPTDAHIAAMKAAAGKWTNTSLL